MKNPNLIKDWNVWRLYSFNTIVLVCVMLGDFPTRLFIHVGLRANIILSL
jgi:hypothetical protein